MQRLMLGLFMNPAKSVPVDTACVMFLKRKYFLTTASPVKKYGTAAIDVKSWMKLSIFWVGNVLYL